MKAKVAGVLAVLLISTISCSAQRTIRVEAQNNDISNNLDLQAVASTFGDSRNLEDFERRLNDYDSQISNLDLNNDGQIDYLRVIEDQENNVHVVVIQAVLDRDVYQDVATIVVERKNNRRTIVQVIGDPYLYGNNYVIEPVFIYPPTIYSYLWGYNYQRWNSPYYYGYYPRYYRIRSPFEMNFYLSNIHSRINMNNRYYYSERRMSDYSNRLYQSIGRNDYEKRYPDRNFASRNKDIVNKKSFDIRRSNNTIYDRRNSNSSRVGGSSENNGGSVSGSRTNTNRSTDRGNVNGSNRVQDDVYQSRSVRSNGSDAGNTANGQNGGSRSDRVTQSPSGTSTPRGTEIRQNDPNNNLQQRRNAAVTERPQSVVTRNNNSTRSTPAVGQPSRATENKSTRSTPVVTQPSRSTDNKAVERKATETTRSRESNTQSGSRSSSENTGRR